MEHELWKIMSHVGEIDFSIELACKLNDTCHAGEGRLNALLAIIANDWGRFAVNSLRERKVQRADLTEFRLKWWGQAKIRPLFWTGH
jgi:hypothetical protein